MYHYDYPIGRVYIAESDGAVTDVAFRPVPGASTKETPLIAKTNIMLREYFDGKRRDFAGLPLRTEGTEFQKRAWDALLDIPYGQTRTYSEQAEAIGKAKACRAVGTANSRNPISIIIPCHRVIGANGTLTGYGGGLDVKRALLQLESNNNKSV